MTGVSERTERAPVRARSGRRPLPPIIFLLVLALIALGVWWNVLRQDKDRQASKDAACSTAQQAAPSLDPTTVQVRVLNATDQQGLAQTAAAALKQAGFVVDEIGNDSSGRQVTGVGEVRHGKSAGGTGAARFVALYLPGATDFQDTRATDQVDVVVGPQYTGLAPADQVAAALTGGQSAQAAC